MKDSKFRKFITNNNRFKQEHPDYRRVFLLNTLLLNLVIICLIFATLNIIIPGNVRAIYINLCSAILAVFILIYFHKTNNIKMGIYLFVLLLIATLLVFFEVRQNNNYALYWIAVLPPVVYFLLGQEKARIIISFFCIYMLYFILSNYSSWQPAEFNIESILNIAGATFALIVLISYFETSRKESSDALLSINNLLEENKTELRLILDSAAEGIYGIDSDGICTFCNARSLELLGYKDEKDLIGKNMHFLIHNRCQNGSEMSVSECKIHKAITSGEKVHADDEIFWRSDGTCFNVEFFSYPKYNDNTITGAVVTFTDISERKRNEARIQYLSCHDALTGLINRQCFEAKIKKYDKEEYYPISIIYGDLNELKLTNDIFGHAAGDKLIKTAAAEMKKACRKNDIVARTGGDEFIWLLPNTDTDTAKRVIERIKKELLKVKSIGIFLGISMGADTKYTCDQDIEQTMRNAENEMYQEKAFHRKNSESLILQELISALHKRNPRGRIHSENTSRLCEEMGTALGWSTAEIKQIKDAGYFHDIGKIALSDKLLNPLTELTPQEKFEVKQHAVVGYRILNLFYNTLDLAEAVYYHHERWDGSGYPKGLKGEEIPLQSRIIAIVEQYDHLVNPFNKSPVSKGDALLCIQGLSGTKFDPGLTDVFIDLIRKSPI